MARPKKPPEGDDGRTVADMNVEGMPWYTPRSDGPAPGEKHRLTARETLSMIGGALGAALLVAACFALVYFLFISFCDFVWFR